MEISYKDSQFKIKGKTGILYSKTNGVLIESLDGSSSKELKGAGEYEVSGISVVAVNTEEATVFVYEIDSLRICNLDGLTKKLADNKLSQIGDIDILLVPVTDQSIEMTQQLESYYIIPFGYKNEEDLGKFLKESGLMVEKMNKFSIKKEELIEDSTAQIVVLST